MNYRPGSPIVVGPIFLDDARTRIGAVLRNPANPNDLRWAEDRRESGSRFVRDVFEQHDEAAIEANTRREIAVSAANRKAMRAGERDAKHRAKERALFDAKARAVDGIEHPKLRRMARKAETPEQVAGIEAAAVALKVLADEKDDA